MMVVTLGCPAKQTREPTDAEQLMGESFQAAADNDIPRAIDLLEQSIAIKPDPYAHFQLAMMLIKQTPEDAAKPIENCKAGLAIAVEGPTKLDLEWLLAECEKPAGQRFKGANENPPSLSK